MSFTYLEKVIIETDDKEYVQVNHKVGVVISESQIDNNQEVYVLYFTKTDDEVWTVPSKYLKSTGEFEDEINIYDGSIFQVHVDKDGKGKIVK